MLVPEHIAKLIAKAIYEADCEAREQIVNGQADHSERSYFGAILALALAKLGVLIDHLGSLQFRIDGRDTHSYDGIFVFRLGNDIKIGICESKLLRFVDENGAEEDLDKVWDWKSRDESHFHNQIKVFDKWNTDCATWVMLMSNLPPDGYSPPLESNGSSCSWLSDIKKHIEDNDIGKKHLWSFQDVLHIEEEKITNLESIIYEILICNRGSKISVDETSRFANIRYGDDERRINIPLPVLSPTLNTASNSQEISSFLVENKLDSYYYIVLNKKGFNEF